MKLFSKLRIALWPPHHRADPRLHEEESLIAESWPHGSTEAHIPASDRQWVDSIIEQASVFTLDCFIKFEFNPEQQTIACRRVEQMNQPGLDLGSIKCANEKQWEYFWRFVYDHFGCSLKIPALEGEYSREFVIWTSPNHKWDTYALTPHAVSIKLCIRYPSKHEDETSWCGCDGPCTAH